MLDGVSRRKGARVKKYLVLCSVFMLIVSFQNCSKVGQTNIDSSGNLIQGQQYNKYSVEPYPILSLWDYTRYQYLDLDLSTGHMEAFEEAGQVSGNTYCLKSSQLAEVQQILAGAEICEPIVYKASDAGNLACTMNYRYPYAILTNSGEEVRLGEMTSGCDAPIDLCEVKAQDLRRWTENVVDHLLDGSVTDACP